MALGVAAQEGIVRVLVDSEVTRNFHELYYGSSALTWLNTRWMGIPLAKCPLDLWQYQEIIFETQPDVIIETGTWCGGSALYLRDMLRLCGKSKGLVITIDTAPMGTFKDEDGIIQLVGSSVSKEIIHEVSLHIVSSDKVMVILDSDHSQKHVKDELEVYAQLVSSGQYLIIEDTNVNGNPTNKEHGPGPMEALQEWLPQHPEFICDEHRERFMMTFNPMGYLKRIGRSEEGKEDEIRARAKN